VRVYRVIPLTVKSVRSESDRFHLGIGDLAPFFVAAGVEFALHFEPGPCRRCCDEIDHSLIRSQRFAPPVERDEREQTMFDLVPLARARRKVAYGDWDCELVSEAL